MTAEEAIAEIRSIAGDMAIRGIHPGEVSGSVQYRVKDFLYRCPFQPWFAKGRKYLSKPGPGVTVELDDGQTVVIPIIAEHGGVPAVIDDTAVEICKAIIERLTVANWREMVSCEMTPQYRDWTPEVAEAAILRAARELPDLCDKLEQATGGAAVPTVGAEPGPKPPPPEWLGPFTVADIVALTGDSERTIQDRLTKGDFGNCSHSTKGRRYIDAEKLPPDVAARARELMNTRDANRKKPATTGNNRQSGS
ncbi:MAG: hypothetical protein SH850_24095 [Planctomycetaceae bacterium]|nr:hypothetical protein [Planctomycetaceae bacterium]